MSDKTNPSLLPEMAEYYRLGIITKNNVDLAIQRLLSACLKHGYTEEMLIAEMEKKKPK